MPTDAVIRHRSAVGRTAGHSTQSRKHPDSSEETFYSPISPTDDRKSDGDNQSSYQARGDRERGVWSVIGVFLALLTFRVFNALTVRTFFQPDEFFQSLEPAWQLAFGNKSGAYVTWEWHHHLRSSLHPIIFACVYRFAAAISDWLDVSPRSRDEILVAAPKLFQAVVAAAIDFYTWRLAQKIEKPNSGIAKWTLCAMISSPWQWYCSVRSFSNSLEAALTAMALYFWPWHWLTPIDTTTHKLHVFQSHDQTETPRLLLAFFLAALSVVIRPTGVILWLVIGLATFFKSISDRRILLVEQAVSSGIAALVVSCLADRMYYGTWALPAFQFFRINAIEKIADFYGVSRTDYYFTEGLPLLLCIGPLPFAIWGLGRGTWSMFSRRSCEKFGIATAVCSVFAIGSLAVIAAFTAIPHKEARFLYPLLPVLMILAATEFQKVPNRYRGSLVFKVGLVLVVGLQTSLAWYVTRDHQRGVIDVMHHVRQTHDHWYLEDDHQRRSNMTPMTVGFLMPCHSTPWRSHLIHPEIQAWALTCEPPLGIPIEERATYRDEADQFYDDPKTWVETHMRDHAGESPAVNSRYWPDKFAIFEQLRPTIEDIFSTEHRPYYLCHRLFNTHWHDDWRRQGDVLVYCKTPDK